MQASEITEISSTIDGLISSTQKGAMKWTEANPSTYVWLNVQRGGARIVLQRTAEGVHVWKDEVIGSSCYQLQAIEPGARQPTLSVNSDEISSLRGKLAQLFDTVQTSIAREGISFLKSILPRDK